MTSKIFPLIFLGTDHISLSALDQLIEHPAFEVKGVISGGVKRRGRGMSFLASPVAQRSKELGLCVLSPDNLKDPVFLKEVKKWQAEWAILLSYGKILPQEFLDLFPKRALNFHASLLPRWRGAAPVQRGIMAGDQQFGMSLQVMEDRLDQGPLIGSRSFLLTENKDAQDAFKKMVDLQKELLPDLLKYMEGKLKPSPQDESQSSYAHKIDKKESRIIWSDPARKISNQIRALVMGPQAYTFYKNHRVKIYQARYQKGNKEPFGGVVELASDHFKVACGEGMLSIFQLQPESKKIISAGEFIRGYTLESGQIFKTESV